MKRLLGFLAILCSGLDYCDAHIYDGAQLQVYTSTHVYTIGGDAVCNWFERYIALRCTIDSVSVAANNYMPMQAANAQFREVVGVQFADTGSLLYFAKCELIAALDVVYICRYAQDEIFTDSAQ